MKKVHTFDSFLNESFHGPDGKPIGVDRNHMPITEASVEFIDKGDKEKMISIKDKGTYLVLAQADFLGKQVEFIVNKEQIADLVKILEKMK